MTKQKEANNKFEVAQANRLVAQMEKKMAPLETKTMKGKEILGMDSFEGDLIQQWQALKDENSAKLRRAREWFAKKVCSSHKQVDPNRISNFI